MILAFAASLIGTTAPEVSYDALIYHLAIPQAYVRAGGLVDLPYNHFSTLPALMSMLHFWALDVGGMPGAKVLNFLVAASGSLAVYAWGRDLENRRLALLAALIWSATPLAGYLTWMTNSDLAAAFFLVLALAAFWRWIDSPEKNERTLFVAGLLGGFALVCKYTAAIGLIPLVAACAWFSFRRRTWRPFLLYAGLLLLPLLPWWVRSARLTGNPFYPFLIRTLGGRNADTELLPAFQATTRLGSPGFSPLAHLAKTLSDATDRFPDLPFAATGPIFAGAAPLLLLPAVRRRRWVRWVSAYVAAAYFGGLSYTYFTRYLIPIFAPLCLAVAFAVLDLPAAWLRGFAACVFSAMLGSNLYWSAEIFLLNNDGLAVASGRLTAGEYLAEPHDFYPNPLQGSFAYLAGQAPGPKGRALIVGDPRSFYCPWPSLSNATDDIPPLYEWAREAGGARELGQKLDSEGIEAIVTNFAEGKRVDPPRYATSAARELIAAVLRAEYVKTYEDRWATVHRRKGS
jgi:hypothetical protein